MAIQVKICGVTDEAAVQAAVAGGATYIGFVGFKQSPRYIPPHEAAVLQKKIPSNINVVYVLVDPSYEDIEAITKHFTPDFLQLHGEELPTRVQKLQQKFHIPIIKALPVRNKEDVDICDAYGMVADMLLFDTKAPEGSDLPGGNGIAFDWSLLTQRNFPLPWMLSGGLNAENIAKAVRISGATAVDISSGVETGPGTKAPDKIKQFLETTKEL